MYIDVLESVNLLMSSNGAVLRNDVSGKVIMKTLLSGEHGAVALFPRYSIAQSRGTGLHLRHSLAALREVPSPRTYCLARRRSRYCYIVHKRREGLLDLSPRCPMRIPPNNTPPRCSRPLSWTQRSSHIV